jgi:hypothetical protein
MIKQVNNDGVGLEIMILLLVSCCVLSDYRDIFKEDKKIVK